MRPVIVSGSAHPALAEDLARALGCELAPCHRGRFPDGEQEVEVQANVRGQPVFVVQPLGRSAGDQLLELLLLADACHRAGAASVAAVVPYVAFARQDRVTREGQPLGAKVLARALGTAAFSLVVAVDLHSAVIASCIDAPVAHLTAEPLVAGALRPHVRADSVVVAPDLGAVKLAEAYARHLGLPLALVSKSRVSAAQVSVQRVVGDVAGKRPIIVDDMISTGATVQAALDALVAHGALGEAVVATTHGLFSGAGLERILRPDVTRVLATDSLPPAAGGAPQVEIVGLAPLLAEAIRRIVGARGLNELLSPR
ncbi:ribose-phosphate diphosphokinase [Anaeromyxobacter oryzae]|uniref:ribose-phosphate diphosphokinase n=1 Tax=Anaeromyxobacter oryzae TaxID=2918170 RepID=A0ABN6MMK6_9BACT|nr:ribose-phosphate diphosphokinase [Anaeromyxobacter oryzae]BDG02274.1 ribose-phosphate pyrophosphokinase [Anaeromyxobacter oryzae]